MAEISTNIILDGITLALRSAFPGSHIESNAVKQGLRQPAFIVLLVNAEVTDYPAQRKKRLPRFDVLYFPKSGREDCYGVAEHPVENDANAARVSLVAQGAEVLLRAEHGVRAAIVGRVIAVVRPRHENRVQVENADAQLLQIRKGSFQFCRCRSDGTRRETLTVSTPAFLPLRSFWPAVF